MKYFLQDLISVHFYCETSHCWTTWIRSEMFKACGFVVIQVPSVQANASECCCLTRSSDFPQYEEILVVSSQSPVLKLVFCYSVMQQLLIG